MKPDLTKILSYTKETETGCLEWTKCLNTDGYPRANINGNVNIKIHRVVYQLSNIHEDISNKVIRHTCDNPKCINPTHLLSGTHKDNMNDRDLRDRHGKQKISLTDVNTIKHLYFNKVYSVKKLAAMYKVAESTIRYSLYKRKVGT